ncbi:MAG: AzlD domain-containing protein [Acidimicrobiales bacterium]|jgi:branched-subunit amino acid transport protein|tara:strand:- start:164 stop:463 length:300 start_codon:yes stop_codon:yes gene_type:complete
MSWTAILVLAAGAYGFKLAGVLVGTRIERPLLRRSVSLVPPALFCALIALQTFERDTELVLDARVAGLVAALFATWRKVPFIGVIVVAMAATALARVLT